MARLRGSVRKRICRFTCRFDGDASACEHRAFYALLGDGLCTSFALWLGVVALRLCVGAVLFIFVARRLDP